MMNLKWTGLAWRLGLIVLLMGALSSSALAGESKSLTRGEDPVVVKASAVAPMKGAKIDALALMAWDGSAMKPIPFQVDERAANGMFVYTSGPKANPKDGAGDYTGDDELVFMAWDTGDQADAGTALPCGATRSAEITVSGGGGKAWVYLLECADAPPRSDVDYVEHESAADRDWVRTERYHFSEKRGASFFDRLALKGDSGKVGKNLVDRIKGRAHMEITGGLFDIDTPESGLEGSIQSWIDGPVRVVHLMEAFISLSVVKLNMGGKSENLFYANYFVTPIQVDMPVNPSTIFRDFNMRYAIDWRKEFEGTKYYDANHTQGMVLDGKMSDAEKAMDFQAEHDWYALGGPHGNLVVHATMPAKWKNIVKFRLYYVDDVTAEDPPEDDPGQRCPGFLIDSMSDIGAGKYKYYLYYMVPDKKPPAAVPEMLDIVKKPLKTSAKAGP